MADATLFTFIGVRDLDVDGNVVGTGALFTGFPFLFDSAKKVDVTDYDFWNTLGGVSGSSATEAQINTSWQNAVQLYWNLYAVNTNRGSINADDDLTAGSADPIDRCDAGGMAMYRTDSSPYTVTSSDFTPCIVKMYAGDTSVEANFIGYGVESNSISRAFEFEGDTDLGIRVWSDDPTESVVYLCSYGNDPGVGSITNSTVSGINFLKATKGSDVSISSLEFYNYPTT